MRVPLLECLTLAVLAASPVAAQRCTNLQPVPLAQRVAAAKSFPRPMNAAQVQELAQILPVIKANPQRGVAPLRAWVAKGGYTAGERCPLVYALMRAVQTQTVPPATTSASSAGVTGGSGAGAVPLEQQANSADAIQAQIAELTAQLAGLQSDLRQLQAQLAAEQQNLKDLMAAKPVAPDAKATDQQKAAFAKAQSDWQAKVDSEQMKIQDLQAAVTAKQAQIAAKEAELQKLQGAVAGAVDQAVSAAIP